MCSIANPSDPMAQVLLPHLMPFFFSVKEKIAVVGSNDGAVFSVLLFCGLFLILHQ
jgi:hypothetical protein